MVCDREPAPGRAVSPGAVSLMWRTATIRGCSSTGAWQAGSRPSRTRPARRSRPRATRIYRTGCVVHWRAARRRSRGVWASRPQPTRVMGFSSRRRRRRLPAGTLPRSSLRPVYEGRRPALVHGPSWSAATRYRYYWRCVCGMVMTGQWAWWSTPWLTEPSSMPVKPPCPRVPTTSPSACSDALARTCTGWPCTTS